MTHAVSRSDARRSCPQRTESVTKIDRIVLTMLTTSAPQKAGQNRRRESPPEGCDNELVNHSIRPLTTSARTQSENDQESQDLWSRADDGVHDPEHEGHAQKRQPASVYVTPGTNTRGNTQRCAR